MGEIEDKIANREVFFQKALDFFVQNNSVAEAKRLSQELGKVVEIEVLEGGGKEINKYYWQFVRKHIRPLISSKPEEEESDVLKRIDIYKILSTTEYAVMVTKPLFVKINGRRLDYSNQLDYKHELLLNAQFAFSCAMSLISHWDGYEDIFEDYKTINDLLSYKEKVGHREKSMTLKDEHIGIIAFSNLSGHIPVLTNATWWRLFCLCCYMVKNKKFDNI